LPKRTKPNSSRTDFRVNNEVKVNVAKGTEDGQDDNTRLDERNAETRKEPRREVSQKYNF
jgi:hypothetical protein